MNLTSLKLLFTDKGCKKVYVKSLAPNDNSKNQVYFGGNFEILNILPLSDIITEEAGDWNKERFKAKINFAWLDEEGLCFPAPQAQLILYPKYPEVRFSGFLAKCEKPPSNLMTQRTPGRLLFFSVSRNGMILGYVTSPDSDIAKEFNQVEVDAYHGVFSVLDLPKTKNNKSILLKELKRIHELGWIDSKRLDRDGNIIPCNSPNCGGYTLEAELGVTPNSYAKPDFMGWEIKQFGVTRFDKITSKVITLMTPEPTDGFYKIEGIESFIRKYGYEDKRGRDDRLNFGGVHKIKEKHSLTNLEIRLVGFDVDQGKIRNTNGKIVLIDENENEAASWSFVSMLKHWNRKHNQACFIPSLLKSGVNRQYKYSNSVMLGEGTDFQYFLNQMAVGNIYYDPALKLENASTKPKWKARNQFRIKSGNLINLYNTSGIVDVTK